MSAMSTVERERKLRSVDALVENRQRLARIKEALARIIAEVECARTEKRLASVGAGGPDTREAFLLRQAQRAVADLNMLEIR